MPHKPAPEAVKNAKNIVAQRGGEIIKARRSDTQNATLVTSEYVSTANPYDPRDCRGTNLYHYSILYVISDEEEDIGARALDLSKQLDAVQNQIGESSLACYSERGSIERADKAEHIRSVIALEEPNAQAVYQEGYERDMQQWSQGLSGYMASGNAEKRRESLRSRYPRARDEKIESWVAEPYIRKHPKPREWEASQERKRFIEQTEKTARDTYRISEDASDRIRELEDRQTKHEAQLRADAERLAAEVTELEEGYGFKVSDLGPKRLPFSD